MKTLSFFVVCILTFFTSNAQVFEWVKTMGSSGDDEGLSIAVDDMGNVITIGTFRATGDFDPGPGTFNLVSNGFRDVFVQKLDVNGNLIWVNSFGGSGEDLGRSLDLDEHGNIFITGQFTGMVDFDPGPGISNLTASQSDIFILKLDANGQFVRVSQLEGPAVEGGFSIVVDESGNIFSTGSFSAFVDFDPGSGTSTLNSFGSDDVYIQKMDSAGNLLWARHMGGTNQDFGLGIATDHSGNVYTTGRFRSFGADFDPGPDTLLFSPNGGDDFFIHKMDPNGNLLWAKSIGGSDADYGNSIKVDSFNNVYLTGFFRNTVDFDPGPGIVNLTSLGSSDSFVLKLDSNGDLIWVKQLGGTQTDQGFSIDIDDAGNVYSTGWYYGTIDLDPGPGTQSFSAIQNDIYISVLNQNGDYVWGTDLGGFGFEEGLGIAVSNVGDILTTGQFSGTVDFDPGPGSAIIATGNNNNRDIFVHKFSQCPATFSTDTIIECDSYIWIDGNTYTASNNTATFALTNSSGCDSIITLDLTINNSSSATYAIIACDSFTWIDGNTYLSSNNSATFTIPNSVGCDSVISLNLTINQSNGSTDLITACDSFTWIDGITYFTSNNTSSLTLSNSNGCDSIVFLDLTINRVSDKTTTLNGAIITSNNANASYQWMDCDNHFAVIIGEVNQSFTASVNGNYAVELTENTCVDTSDCVAVISVGILENTFESELILYPNPGNGFFTLDLGAFYEDIEISISNMSGKEIGSEKFINVRELKLNIAEPSGIYFISIRSVGRIAEFKFLKQ